MFARSTLSGLAGIFIAWGVVREVHMIRGLFPVWLFVFFASVFCSVHANADSTTCELFDLNMPAPQLEVNVPDDTTQVGSC